MIHVRSPFAHFDDRAKRVVEMTRQRAETLRSQVIGPEHLLLDLQAEIARLRAQPDQP